ncbi:MAG: TIGR00730 family Rossman fold protein [Leptospiraceae bacterium]|nr:TIGR00730 family Rossman fold protein [Leptospiraceae bacterium]
MKPPRAYENPDFLYSEHARSLRILSEYHYPLHRFEELGVTDTVVFFGSARIPSPEKRRDTQTSNSRVNELDSFYDAAREVSNRLTRWSLEQAKPKGRNFLVCTGGGPGIMEASNRGAFDAGGASIGLNIELPREQHPNPFITEELNFDFHYFFTRKFWFLYFARALIAFPGGFGTLDELFETLTLQQTMNIRNQIPVFLYGKRFWERLIDFDFLVEYGLISPGDRKLFQIVDSVSEAMDAMIPVLESQIQ